MLRNTGTGIACALIIVLMPSTPMYAAEIETKHHLTDVQIVIQGEITSGDALKLQSVLDELDFERINHALVTILSPGGDVIEALAMGRLLRQRFIPTMAPVYLNEKCLPGSSNDPHSCICLSACVLVWAAGVQRSGGERIFEVRDPSGHSHMTHEGSLGIHRPRFDETYFAGLTADQAEDKYQELMGFIATYLDEMDVPAWIFDKMISVPSGRIQFLSPSDVRNIEHPPAISEWITSKCGSLKDDEREDFLTLSRQTNLTRIEQRAYDDLKEKWGVWARCQRELFHTEQRSRQPRKGLSFR